MIKPKSYYATLIATFHDGTEQIDHMTLSHCLDKAVRLIYCGCAVKVIYCGKIIFDISENEFLEETE